MNDRESGLYDLIFDDDDEYARGARRVHEIVQSLNPGATNLLDVGCGPARHLARLRQWYRVEGLDINDVMLDQARGRLPDVTFTKGDMRDFRLNRRFDAMTCLASGIVEMKSEAELQEAIANMAGHLNPGGVLIIEPWDLPENYEPDSEPYITGHDEPGRKIVMMEITTLQGDTWRQESHFLIGTADQIEHLVEVSEFRAVTHAENLAAFEAAGLNVSHDPIGLLGRGLYIGVKSE